MSNDCPRADLERRQCQWDEALGTVEAALRLAAPRGMRLDQADALVLRARIRLDRAQATPSAGPKPTPTEPATTSMPP